jgi:hypothetical protein
MMDGPIEKSLAAWEETDFDDSAELGEVKVLGRKGPACVFSMREECMAVIRFRNYSPLLPLIRLVKLSRGGL